MLGFGKPRQPSAGSALQVEHPPKQGPLQRLRRERQRGDHAALATGAHAYLPAVQIAQAADDRQADATALRMAGMGAAIAALEQLGGVFFAQARAAVSHRH